MTEFDISQFCTLLRAVPEWKPLAETPKYSEYLQKQVFDVLREDGAVDLAELDWNAIDMKDLISINHAKWLNSIPDGWLNGVNHYVHATSGTAAEQRKFF